MNNKKKKSQNTNIRNEEENIIIYLRDNENIRNYYKQLYADI